MCSEGLPFWGWHLSQLSNSSSAELRSTSSGLNPGHDVIPVWNPMPSRHMALLSILVTVAQLMGKLP